MKKTTLWKFLAVAMILVSAFSFAACGSKDNGDDSGATEGNGITVKVGSKDFTEQLILGQITIQLLEANGYTVEDKTNVSGSDVCWTALKDGEFDVYWEYTGTIWQTFLGNDTMVAGSDALYDATKEALAKDNEIVMGDKSSMNDTYALVMPADKAKELGITSYSELGKYITENSGKLKIACDQEFSVRADGLPGLSGAYGIDFGDNISLMDMGLVFTALADGKADVGMVFATDARINKYGLTVLTDDKSYFPVYNAVPVYRADFAADNTEIVDLLNKVAALIDDKTMVDLNYQVDVDGDEPEDVAAQWLTDSGLVK